MRRRVIISLIKSEAAGTPNGFPQCFLSCGLFFILFVFIPAPAPGDTPQSILRRSGYPKPQHEAIGSLLKEAAKDGIPEELLLPRLEEGIAKRVPGERLLQVLEEDVQRLKEAREILLGIEGGRAFLEDQAAWARTANLLAGGVSEEEIKQIAFFCRNRREDYRSASYLFVSLIKWDLSRESSLELTIAVLKSSIGGDDFAGIVDLLVKGRRLRISPETLTERIIDQLPLVQTLEELEERSLYK